MTANRYPALGVLVDAFHRRANGRLVFKREGVERSVYLIFRKVLFADSTEKKNRLELILATRKLLSKEEVIRLAGLAKAAGSDFMGMVQREGVLKDSALFDVMTERARDIISDLVTWPEAEVQADPQGFRAAPVLPLNAELLPILLNGLFQRFGAEDCRAVLGSEDQVPTRFDRPYAVRELSHSEHAETVQAILAQIDGKHSVAEILEGVSGDSLGSMKVLALLKMLGVVDLPETGEAAAPPAVPETSGGSDAPVLGTEDEGVVVAAEELSTEEKAALSNIFEGATNLLEESPGNEDDLEIVVDAGGPADDDLVVVEEDQPDEHEHEFEVDVDVDEEPPAAPAPPPVAPVTPPPPPPVAPVTPPPPPQVAREPEPEPELELEPEPVPAPPPPPPMPVIDTAPPPPPPMPVIDTAPPAPPMPVIDNGPAPEVQDEFNALLGIDPEAAGRLFSAALEFFQRGRIGSAIEMYRQAIDKDPSNAEYYSALGVAHLEDGCNSPADDQAAMRAFLEAVKLSPDVPKNYFYLGKIQERRGDPDSARQSYEEALRRDGNYAPARQALETLAQAGKPGDGGPKPPAGSGFGFLRKLFSK